MHALPRFSWYVLSLLTVIAVVLSAGFGGATPILDANFTGAGTQNPQGINTDAPQNAGQTFTVLNTGNLTSVGVEVAFAGQTADNNLNLSIFATTAGLPTGAPLTTTSLPFTSIPTSFPTAPPYTIFTLPGAGLPVTAGDVLAVVLDTISSPGYEWMMIDGAAFGGASIGGLGPPFSLVNPPPNAFHLTTFVDPLAVPEPGSFLLLAFGLVGLLTYSRRLRVH